MNSNSHEIQNTATSGISQFLLAAGKNLLKNWWKILLATVFFGFASFVLHTYLLVGPNEGFLKNRLENSEYFLNFVPEMNRNIPTMTYLSGRLMWLLIPFTVINLAYQIFYQKRDFLILRGKYFAGIFTNSFKGNPTYLPALLGGISVALLLTIIMQNRFSCIVLGIAIFVVISAGERCSLFYICGMIFKKEDPQSYDYTPISGALAGASFGFLLNGWLQTQEYGGTAQYITLAIFATLFLVRMFGKFISKPTGKATIFILIFTGLAPLLTIAALAHDGGWNEAGSTWDRWWRSAGRDIALDLGRLPGALSAVGAFLGSVGGFLGEIVGIKSAAAGTLDSMDNFDRKGKYDENTSTIKPSLDLKGDNRGTLNVESKNDNLTSKAHVSGKDGKVTGGGGSLQYDNKKLRAGGNVNIDAKGQIKGMGYNAGVSGRNIKLGGSGRLDGAGKPVDFKANIEYSGQGFKIGGTGNYDGNFNLTDWNANASYNQKFGNQNLSVGASHSNGNLGANLGWGLSNSWGNLSFEGGVTNTGSGKPNYSGMLRGKIQF